jgi:hypothetical protein
MSVAGRREESDMSGRRTNRGAAASAFVGLLTAGLMAGLVAGCSHSSAPRTPATPVSSVLSRDEPGPDPFLAAQPTSPGAVDPAVAPLLGAAVAAGDAAAAAAEPGLGRASDDERIRAVQRARLQAATGVFTDGHLATVRPRSVLGVGLLPGGAGPVCGLESIVSGLVTAPEGAAALATVAGIDVGDVADYLRSLRAGYLIDDEPVILHGLRNGEITAARTVLAAGTAVLVDDQGLPRLRCRSADPLLPTRFELDGTIVDAAVFADRVVAARIGPDVAAADVVSVDGRFTNRPERALGAPDKVAVSLGQQPVTGQPPTDGGGCGNAVTLAFDDNRLIDGPGDDLRVVELGRFESTDVYVGLDPDHLVLAGRTTAARPSVDIASAIGPGQTVAVVKLCGGSDQGSEVPGPDIDAVAALSWTPPAS